MKHRQNIVSNFQAVDTFLHEVIHALWWAYGIDEKDDEERTVSTMATAFMTCHRDNPWLATWINEALTCR